MNKKQIKYATFLEARDFVRSLGLKSEVEWYKYIDRELDGKNKKPNVIPSKPEVIYKDCGWIDYSDWLGIEYLDFESAKEFVRKLHLNSRVGWYQSYYSVMPDSINIPLSAEDFYKDKGWTNWNEWLGVEAPDYLVNSENLNSPNSYGQVIPEYYSYEESRKFMQKLGLKSLFEWEQFKAGLLSDKGYKPDFIPSYPDEYYKENGWKGWLHWFGNEMISFEEARKFARRLKLRGKKQWFDYKLGWKPLSVPNHLDMPDDPSIYYKDKGWISWEDWLALPIRKKVIFLDFNSARTFACTLGLKNRKEWRDYVDKSKLDETFKEGIPSHPDLVYANNGWINWSDWLGSDNEQKRLKFYRKFEEARKFIHTLKLRSKEEWDKYISIGIEDREPLPADIPQNPETKYKFFGWKNYSDWLGIEYMTYEDARKFIWELKLNNEKEYQQYIDGKIPVVKPRPLNLPERPDIYYVKKGWKGWDSFLGSENRPIIYEQIIEATKIKMEELKQINEIFTNKPHSNYRDFNEARSFARSLRFRTEKQWYEFVIGIGSTTIKKPNDIPDVPSLAYRDKGWIDFDDWLGINKNFNVNAKEMK